MGFSNEEIIEITKKAKESKNKLTHITNKSGLSFEDKSKISLCKHFVMFKNENRLSTKDFAKKLEIEESRMSEILNYKIKKMSIQMLFHHLNTLANISPRFKEYLNTIESVFDLPVAATSAKATKEFNKTFKKKASAVFGA